MNFKSLFIAIIAIVVSINANAQTQLDSLAQVRTNTYQNYESIVASISDSSESSLKRIIAAQVELISQENIFFNDFLPKELTNYKDISEKFANFEKEKANFGKEKENQKLFFYIAAGAALLFFILFLVFLFVSIAKSSRSKKVYAQYNELQNIYEEYKLQAESNQGMVSTAPTVNVENEVYKATEKMQVELNAAKNKYQDLLSDKIKTDKQVYDLQSEKNQISAELEKYKTGSNNITNVSDDNKITEISRQLNDEKDKNLHLSNQKNAVEDNFKTLSMQYQELMNKNSDLQMEIEQLKQNNNVVVSHENVSSSNNDELAKIKQTLLQEKDNCKELFENNKFLLDENENLKKELNENKSKLEQSNIEIEEVKNRFANQPNLISNNSIDVDENNAIKSHYESQLVEKDRIIEGLINDKENLVKEMMEMVEKIDKENESKIQGNDNLISDVNKDATKQPRYSRDEYVYEVSPVNVEIQSLQNEINNLKKDLKRKEQSLEEEIMVKRLLEVKLTGIEKGVTNVDGSNVVVNIDEVDKLKLEVESLRNEKEVLESELIEYKNILEIELETRKQIESDLRILIDEIKYNNRK